MISRPILTNVTIKYQYQDIEKMKWTSVRIWETTLSNYSCHVWDWDFRKPYRIWSGRTITRRYPMETDPWNHHDIFGSWCLWNWFLTWYLYRYERVRFTYRFFYFDTRFDHWWDTRWRFAVLSWYRPLQTSSIYVFICVCASKSNSCHSIR